MYEDRKLTQQEVEDMIDPLKLDLIAYSKLLEEATLSILDEGIKKGWTPEKLTEEIEKLFNDDGIIATPREVRKQDLINEAGKITKQLLRSIGADTKTQKRRD